ncbi:MAG: ribosome maturation factor RimM [Ignavibacteriaceae bacterium]
MDDLYLIAKIVSLHGLDGSVRIISYSDFPERFFLLKGVKIDFFGKYKDFVVENVVSEGENFVIRFKNFSSREASEALIGKKIFVTKENLVELPDDYFYIHDLVGSKVYRKGMLLGEITEVLQLPANDVYVIKGEKEILIPALRRLIVSFSPETKELILSEEEDLYDEEYED